MVEFRVTEKAGPRVAGWRVKPGDLLSGPSFSRESLRYEIDLGQVVEVAPTEAIAPPAPIEEAPAEPVDA